LREATLVATAEPGLEASLRLFVDGEDIVPVESTEHDGALFYKTAGPRAEKRAIDTLAGLRPWLVEVAARIDEPAVRGSRVLDGSFTAVQQSIGFPSNADAFGFLDEAARGYLAAWVDAATVRVVKAGSVEVSGAPGTNVCRKYH
jgi:hypothetical protein